MGHGIARKIPWDSSQKCVFFSLFPAKNPVLLPFTERRPNGVNMANNALSITRGDSGALCVRRRWSDGEDYPFSQGDILRFTVKSAPGEGASLIQKTVTQFSQDGSALIQIDPQDTADLDFLPYWYDVEHTDRSGAVTTLVKPSLFFVGKEITDGT